jgi:hypothetical protein
MLKSKHSLLYVIILFFVSLTGCNNNKHDNSNSDRVKVLFLHHSTGNIIWKGKDNRSTFISKIFEEKKYIPFFFEDYNRMNNTNYILEERNFPKANPYGWKNYPFDYYNIWVKNAGDRLFMDEPTLEILTRQYDLIVFKHCFPGSNILEDTGKPDINSERKSLENYRLQYNALKEKMKEFSDTKFVVWTVPALLEAKTTKDKAVRADNFSKWVKEEWDDPNDNIFLWDFRLLETEGDIYLKPKYARNTYDSHPNTLLAEKTAPIFCKRIIDIIETNGKNTTLTGREL